MHRGTCKRCGASFWESSPGARGEDLCDLHINTQPQPSGRRPPRMQPNSVTVSHNPPTDDLGEPADDDIGELLDLSVEWNDLEISRKALNEEINRLIKVGDTVFVQTAKGWEEATVHWVPYVNGPAATHIYVTLPRLKEPRLVTMGGGIFNSIRIPRKTA